jgi:Skp family chaperone for outer membrane proteins
MLLNITLFLFLISTLIINAQKPQRIAYIDMEYILENVPEYMEAQNTLDSKVAKWRGKLDKLSRYIEKIKNDLANERAILTNDLILDKEDEITLKQEELRRLESLYFGPNGDMFLLRKQLVKPIQDQVFNSIEGIVKKKKYDFVFDKSSDLVMLYSNKKYDISDFVLNEIVRERKIKINEEKRQKKSVLSKEKTEKQKKLLRDREALRKKKDEERKARQKKSEEIRKKRIADIAEKKRILKEKKEAIKKKNNLEQGNN